VSFPTVQLDDLPCPGPVAIDLVPLVAEHDPVIEARAWQSVASQKGKKAFL